MKQKKPMKRSKNDNLEKYRADRIERNTELIRKSLEHIQKLGGTINYSTVSKVTYDISNGDGITAAGISSNKLYRSMVEKAKYENQPEDDVGPDYRHYSLGDMQLELHKLRVEKEKLVLDNKILKGTMSRHVDASPELTTAPADAVLKNENAEVRRAFKSLIDRLQELEVAVFTENGDLELALFQQTIVSNEVLRQYYY